MKTEPALARRFCDTLFDALRESLSDTEKVRECVKMSTAHAPKFPETRFCKGCVLPVVDSVATCLLSREFALDAEQIRLALRCEGYSTLSSIYKPGPNQSGFGGHTWGTNFQRLSKSGRIYPSGSPGYQAVPDFAIVHSRNQKFSVLGETKFSLSKSSVNSLLKSVVNDLTFYLSLPSEPKKSWDYDFGFGIAYAAGAILQEARF